MKKFTKEVYKGFQFNDLMTMLKVDSSKKIPFVFTNGGTDCVAKDDLFTVKSNFNVSEKENEISFILLPNMFCCGDDLFGNNEVIDKTTGKNNFMVQYINNLQLITYLPDDILKTVKDKRLLALGYAEKETKKQILGYIKDKFTKAVDVLEQCAEDSIIAEKELTIHRQIKEKRCMDSLPCFFDYAEIINAEKLGDEIYLTLDDGTTVIFCCAEIIEEETDIVNSCVVAIELYKKENGYELHFLLKKSDENFITHTYYVTYAFKDLKLKD